MTLPPTDPQTLLNFYLSRLQWCCGSAELFNPKRAPDWAKPEDITITPAELSVLSSVVANQQQSNRIGILFEQCFEAYLGQQTHGIPRFNPAHSRVQVQNAGDKTTLGEMDFLYRDVTAKQNIHTELAVKYYLGVANELEQLQQMHHWIGPNKKDRLDLKYKKLFDHQLALSSRAETQNTLKDLNFAEQTLARRYLVKGVLFWPLELARDAEKQALLLPKTINANCEQGYWLSIDNLHDYLTQPQSFNHGDGDSEKWIILERVEWINDLANYLKPGFSTPTSIEIINKNHASEGEKLDATIPVTKRWLHSLDSLKQEINQRFDVFNTPVQIARFTSNQQNSTPVITRYFVTPSSWSETT